MAGRRVSFLIWLTILVC